MGCDIHCYTEYKDKDGKWQPADIWVEDDHYDEGKKTWRVPEHVRPYDGRHYNLFAWLADVRNGTWGENIPVLAEPKGLPGDCCERIRLASEGWDGDGHSHSYFTLEEIQEGWKEMQNERVWFRGHLNPSNPDPKLAEWLATPEDKRGAPPNGYCASGTNCVPFRWSETLAELIGAAVSRIKDYLWNVGFEYDVSERDDNVRFVFWFDN